MLIVYLNKSKKIKKFKMPIEFETKILGIDEEEIERKLLELGAKRKPEVLFKRWIFDLEAGKWLRLRSDGKKKTLTYKNRKGTGISETEEIEVEVEDFQKTKEILDKIPFKEQIYQESKRISFKLKRIEFNLDSWPLIPTYLEIESFSEKKVKEGLALLGLVGKDVGNIGVKEIYNRYGKDLHAVKILKF